MMRNILGLTCCVLALSLRGWSDPVELESREARLYGTAAASPGEDSGLAEYLGYALANNAGLRAAFERYRAALERAPQVGALPDPQLSFTHFVEEIQTRTGPQENRVQLSQRIPWPGKLRESRAVANEEAESLWWEVEARALRVTRDVKVAYHEYAYLAQAIRILDENLTLLKGLEPIVQRRVQTGAGFDSLLRLQVEIGKVDNELESLRQRRSSNSVRLTSLMNIERGAMLPWPVAETEAVRSYPFAELAATLERQNPELKALYFRVRAAEERGDLARAKGKPDFSVGVMYMDTGQAKTAMRPSDSGEDPWGLTLGMSLPFGRGKYKAGVREASARKAAAQQARTQRHNDLVWMLERNVYRLDDALRQSALYRDTLIPRGRQALELTEVAYESGKASLLDLIDSQRELLSFELAYRRAISDYQQRLADLEAICGGQLP